MSTITVTSSGDAGPGTLRQAIADAVSGDTIDFHPSVTTITIASSLNIPVAKSFITIQGPGSGLLTITNALSNIVGGFFINDAADVEISGMTLFGGAGSSRGITNSAIRLTIDDIIISGHTERGIQNSFAGASMTINNSIIELNNSVLSGAGIINSSSATMTINDSIIRQNTSTAVGGGGGIFNNATASLTINNSTIENNVSFTSVGGGGIINDSSSTLIINNTTFNGNTANSGGGILNRNSNATITHSTISNNTGGGITNILNTANFWSIQIYNSTINGNTSDINVGAGVYTANGARTTILNSTITENTTASPILAGGVTLSSPGSLTIGNTIVANNTSGGPNDDVALIGLALITNLGYNLVENTTGVPAGTFSGATNDITGVDPQLNPLGNYGGPTLTQLPQAGSPVIDAGSLTNIPPTETTDQRGFPRISGASVDIGSVEVQAVICYRGDSNILARNCLTGEISEIKACDLLSGVHEVFSINDNDFIPIKYNIVTGLVEQYRLIKMNSLGKNKPNKDLYITGGHEIMLNGLEIKAADVPGAKRFKVKPEVVYSVCTEKRCPILVNNLAVMSWGFDKWHKFVKCRNIDWRDNTANITHSKKLQPIEKSID